MVRTDRMTVKQAASVLAKASWQRNGKRKAMVLQKKKNATNADKRRAQADKELALRRAEIARKNKRALPPIPKKKAAPKKNQTKKPAPKKPPTIIDRGKGKSKATQRKLAMAGQRFTSARPATRSTAIFD